MPTTLADLLGGFEPIDLEALDAQAALQRRVDHKYLVPPDALESLLGRLRGGFRALEVAGVRASRYESVYFDTSELACFRDHVEDRLPRVKVRSRRYVETGDCVFEAKLKLRPGETVKESLDEDCDDHGRVTPEARAFLERAVAPRGPRLDLDDLGPTLTTRYRRGTLGAREGSERVTLDDELVLTTPSGAHARLSADRVLVESKSEDGDAEADRVLRGAGFEPVSLSKYRAGIGLLVGGAPPPELARLFTTEAGG